MEKISKIECGDIVLKKLGKEYWELYTDFKIEIFFKTFKYTFIIKKGYKTDLASVPKAVRNIADNGSGSIKVSRCALVHDALYSTHYLGKDDSDYLFYKMLQFYKFNMAFIYWKSVSWFGKSAWKRHDKAYLENMKKSITFEQRRL